MFADKLAAGERYERIDDARKQAGEVLGSSPKSGTSAAKDVDEAVEIGVVLAARQIVKDGQKNNPRETYKKLVDLYERQPNLSVRTSTSMKEQAYSTPAPLSFLTGNLLGVKPNDKVYDSSAGNGMLLIASDNPVANELNPDRVKGLQSQGIQTSQEDATYYQPSLKPDKIIINPPFGKVLESDGRASYSTLKRLLEGSKQLRSIMLSL